MVRAADREARNRGILSSIIENYIKTHCAVSSEDLCQHFDCSSATVRNIMCELEDQWYLTHLHTSGGRLPTDKGYRYYVDMLLSPMELFKEERERITREYNRQLNRLEDILEKTSEVLSAFSRCAGIVAFSNMNNKIYYNGASFMIEHPELKNIDNIRSILRLLEEKKMLLEIINRDLKKKLNVYIGGELPCQDISGCSLVVSTYDIEERPSGRIAVLGPRSMNYGQVIPTIEYVSLLLGKALENL